MNSQKRALIDDHGRVRFHGYDYEGRTLTVHHRTPHHLVVKVSGGTCWAAIGQRDYVPAQFEVYDIVGGSGRSLVVEEIVTFPLSRKASDSLITDPVPDITPRRFSKRHP